MFTYTHTSYHKLEKRKKKKSKRPNSPQIGLVLNSEPGIERDRKDLTSELWGWEAFKKKKKKKGIYSISFFSCQSYILIL